MKGTIEDIPMENNQADRIIASLILHETESLSGAVQEIHRVIKNGRVLVLSGEGKRTGKAGVIER